MMAHAGAASPARKPQTPSAKSEPRGVRGRPWPSVHSAPRGGTRSVASACARSKTLWHPCAGPRNGKGHGEHERKQRQQAAPYLPGIATFSSTRHALLMPTLAWGKGRSGTGSPRNRQIGPHPSFTE